MDGAVERSGKSGLANDLAEGAGQTAPLKPNDNFEGRPHRVHRRRSKGWKLPPNTVSVTRPGKFGNPFDFRKSDCCWLALSYGCRGDRLGRQEASVKAFREWINPPPRGKKLVRMERGIRFGSDEKDCQIGPRFIVGPPPSIDTIRKELRGKNLACFCALDQPCHVDVLLELANA